MSRIARTTRTWEPALDAKFPLQTEMPTARGARCDVRKNMPSQSSPGRERAVRPWRCGGVADGPTLAQREHNRRRFGPPQERFSGACS